jgi:hypothetical protein
MKWKITLGIAGTLAFDLLYASGAGLLADYRNAGAGPFSQSSGSSAWIQEHPSPDGGGVRSCASCHGADLTQSGKHVTTGKSIKPMALSINSTRLSDPQKVEKWFRRNCRWTLGRECTPQEKGDFIQFMSSR